MAVTLLFIATLFVAWSNGANDNFKGVATLYGGGVATYRTALTITTIATLAGSLCSLLIATGLVKAFSGQGLVPPEIAASPQFLVSVALGAGSTIILATFLGFPVSTTHGLTGALLGVGLAAAGSSLKPGVLVYSFLAPLILGPLLSIGITVPLYKLFHTIRVRFQANATSCICVGLPQMMPATGPGFSSSVSAMAFQAPVTVGDDAMCRQSYAGHVIGISVQHLVDAAHYFTASAVCFARGLNDAPKITGLIFAVNVFNLSYGISAIAVAMAIGGVLGARKVAETMSHRIATMNDGQAFTANLVTAFLVILASRFGLPVSTTHVSVGAITGAGIVSGTANLRSLSGIVLSWVLTLPIAAIIGAITYASIGPLMR